MEDIIINYIKQLKKELGDIDQKLSEQKQLLEIFRSQLKTEMTLLNMLEEFKEPDWNWDKNDFDRIQKAKGFLAQLLAMSIRTHHSFRRISPIGFARKQTFDAQTSYSL